MQTVADLMVPVEGYTVVADKAPLHAAIEALEEASGGIPDDPTRPRDRAVLVRRGDGRILGNAPSHPGQQPLHPSSLVDFTL